MSPRSLRLICLAIPLLWPAAYVMKARAIHKLLVAELGHAYGYDRVKSLPNLRKKVLRRAIFWWVPAWLWHCRERQWRHQARMLVDLAEEEAQAFEV